MNFYFDLSQTKNAVKNSVSIKIFCQNKKSASVNYAIFYFGKKS